MPRAASVGAKKGRTSLPGGPLPGLVPVKEPAAASTKATPAKPMKTGAPASTAKRSSSPGPGCDLPGLRPSPPATAEKKSKNPAKREPSPGRQVTQPSRRRDADVITVSDDSDSGSSTDSEVVLPASPVQPPAKSAAARPAAPPSKPRAAPAVATSAAVPPNRLGRAVAFGIGAVFLALVLLAAIVSRNSSRAQPGALVESSRAVSSDVAGPGALVVASNALANFSGHARVVIDKMPLYLVLAFLTGGVYGAGTA